MREQWVIGAIFTCHECGEEWQDYRTASNAARRHASTTGHEVGGEVTYAVHYNTPTTHAGAPEDRT